MGKSYRFTHFYLMEFLFYVYSFAGCSFNLPVKLLGYSFRLAEKYKQDRYAL